MPDRHSTRADRGTSANRTVRYYCGADPAESPSPNTRCTAQSDTRLEMGEIFHDAVVSHRSPSVHNDVVPDYGSWVYDRTGSDVGAAAYLGGGVRKSRRVDQR